MMRFMLTGKIWSFSESEKAYVVRKYSDDKAKSKIHV